MKSWKKHVNYRKSKKADGSAVYTITIDGTDVKVDESVYAAYATGGRKIKYMELDLKRDRVLQDSNGKAIKDEEGKTLTQPEREVSLEKLLSENWDFPSP